MVGNNKNTQYTMKIHNIQYLTNKKENLTEMQYIFITEFLQF